MHLRRTRIVSTSVDDAINFMLVSERKTRANVENLVYGANLPSAGTCVDETINAVFVCKQEMVAHVPT